MMYHKWKNALYKNNSIKKDNHSLVLCGNSNKSFKLTPMKDSAIDIIFGLLVLPAACGTGQTQIYWIHVQLDEE